MIKLTENLAIKADENQYICGRPVARRDKDGKEVVTMLNPSYHTTLGNALRTAIQTHMRNAVANDEITTLAEYVKRLKIIQDDFAQLLSAEGVAE